MEEGKEQGNAAQEIDDYAVVGIGLEKSLADARKVKTNVEKEFPKVRCEVISDPEGMAEVAAKPPPLGHAIVRITAPKEEAVKNGRRIMETWGSSVRRLPLSSS